jgi:hypothetical protein
VTSVLPGLHVHVGVTAAGTWDVWASCDGCGEHWHLGELIGARTLGEWYDLHRNCWATHSAQ